MGDTNIHLRKGTQWQYTHDFLSTLLSCYLIPTIDKPMRVHRSSATDNLFVNNPEQVSLSGNIISDISDHFSQLLEKSHTFSFFEIFEALANFIKLFCREL